MIVEMAVHLFGLVFCWQRCGEKEALHSIGLSVVDRDDDDDGSSSR